MRVLNSRSTTTCMTHGTGSSPKGGKKNHSAAFNTHSKCPVGTMLLGRKQVKTKAKPNVNVAISTSPPHPTSVTNSEQDVNAAAAGLNPEGALVTGTGTGTGMMSELDKLRLSTVNRYAQERKNSIIAVGLTVHTAPVEVREKLAVAEEVWNECVTQLTDYPHINEACILST